MYLLGKLYSSLYEMYLMPSDYTKENPSWDTDEPIYDNFYTSWDTFRCLNSYYLFTTLKSTADFVRNLMVFGTGRNSCQMHEVGTTMGECPS